MTHVLMLCPALIPSAILCGHSQLEWLGQKGVIEYRLSTSDRVTSKLLSWADVVFFVRSDSMLEARLAKELKKKGRYLIYVLDDDLLNIPEYIDSAEFYNSRDTQENIREVMSACDCLLSPSVRLREKYGGFFSRTVNIEEPSLAERGKNRVSGNQVKIGFAGSIDRSQDIDDLLTEAIKKLIQNYGDRISVEFFGARPEMADKYGLKHIPYCNSYEEYLQTMESLDWDIGLAPMPNTEFHACKHYNKFAEYIGYGIVGVYSDVEPYRRVIRNGENGLLCGNTKEEWYAALVSLVEDESFRKKLSENCLEEARERFTVEATAIELRNSLGDILEYESDRTIILGIRLLRICCWFRWITSKCRKYGLKTPAIVLKKIKAKLFD